MGRLLKLTGVTITDTTAPKIPHSAGVGGYDRRFYIGAVPGNAGDTLSSIPSLLDGGIPATKADARPSLMTLVDDTGVRAVQMPALDNGYGSAMTLADTISGGTGPVTLAAICKASTGGVYGVSVNGFSVGRLSDGTRGLNTAGGGGAGFANPGSSSAAWCLIIGTHSGVAASPGTAWVDGVKGSTSTMTPGSDKPFRFLSSQGTATPGAIVGEAITWPFVFTDAQAAAVRTALKAKYAALV